MKRGAKKNAWLFSDSRRLSLGGFGTFATFRRGNSEITGKKVFEEQEQFCQIQNIYTKSKQFSINRHTLPIIYLTKVKQKVAICIPIKG